MSQTSDNIHFFNYDLFLQVVQLVLFHFPSISTNQVRLILALLQSSKNQSGCWLWLPKLLVVGEGQWEARVGEVCGVKESGRMGWWMQGWMQGQDKGK